MWLLKKLAKLKVNVLSRKVVLTIILLCLLMIQVMLLFKVVVESTTLSSNVSKSHRTEVLNATLLPAAMYKDYLKEFKKDYNNSEVIKRFQFFKESLKEISRLNQETGATYGLTKFSDMDKRELFPLTFNQNLGGCEYKNMSCVLDQPRVLCDDFHREKNIPDKFDWREKNVVGPVLDQKQCNGCWAFGIVGVMESMAAINKIEIDVRRSIQELIDCSKYTEGCTGGHVARALKWLCDEKWGVVTEQEYPLKLVTESCRIDQDVIPDGLQVKHFCQMCDMKSEEDILRLVYFHGPVMAVVNAEPWRNYIDGVIQMSCFRREGLTHDHVVQIVGYNKAADVPHYIIRNSWGEDFGDRGYVRLALEGNVCGVSDEISFFDIYYRDE